MSQLILCSGVVPQVLKNKMKIVYYPFGDIRDTVCALYWREDEQKAVWSIDEIDKGAFDDLFTKAQRTAPTKGEFCKTKLYMLLTALINADTEILIWYSNFFHKIPRLYNKQAFLKEVYCSIADESGLCETYAWFLPPEKAAKKDNRKL